MPVDRSSLPDLDLFFLLLCSPRHRTHRVAHFGLTPCDRPAGLSGPGIGHSFVSIACPPPPVCPVRTVAFSTQVDGVRTRFESGRAPSRIVEDFNMDADSQRTINDTTHNNAHIYASHHDPQSESQSQPQSQSQSPSPHSAIAPPNAPFPQQRASSFNARAESSVASSPAAHPGQGPAKRRRIEASGDGCVTCRARKVSKRAMLICIGESRLPSTS